MQSMTQTPETQGKQDTVIATANQLSIKEAEIPVEWKYFTFDEIFDFLASGSNSRSDLGDTGDFLYIHYGDIHKHNLCRIDLTGKTIPYILKDKVKGLPLLKDGDLIIADASEDQDGIGKMWKSSIQKEKPQWPACTPYCCDPNTLDIQP